MNELHQFERDLKANGNKIVVENEESEEGIGEIARWKSLKKTKSINKNNNSDINKKREITSKRHVPMVLLVHTKPDLGRNRTYQTYCNEQTE